MDSISATEDASRLPPGHIHSGIQECRQMVRNFIEHGVPVEQPKKSRWIAPSIAKKQARGHSEKIFKSCAVLWQILASREELIRRRWMKKSKDQRRQILLTAWPSMPARHRPDFHQVFDPSARGDPNNEDIFKWPGINLEDLLQAKTLLLLLNSRGRNPPHLFAHADQKSYFLGRKQVSPFPKSCPGEYERISVKLVECHTMLFVGQENAESYGKLVRLENKEQYDDFLSNHNIHFNPTSGLLLLEVQCRLLEFLVECCHLILREIPLLADPSLPELPEPEPLLTTETSYLQLSQITSEAPYRLPSLLETNRIRLLVEAGRSAAEDYLWDLREDPGVFGTVLAEYHTYGSEGIPLAADYISSVPHLSPEDKDRMIWNVMIWTVLTNTYGHLVSWDLLSQKANALDAMTSNDFGQFDRQRPLPRPIENNIIEMAVLLQDLAMKIRHILMTAVPVSARLGVFSFSDGMGGPTLAQGRKPTASIVSEDPLLRMFGLLCDQRHEVITKVGLALVVDEIQRMLDQEPTQKKRLSPFVISLFSELALVSHLFEELTSIYPWAANHQELMKMNKTRCDNSRGDVHCIKKGMVLNDLAPLVTPPLKKFRYPVDKAYNSMNVEAMRQAEENLDRFWKEADYYLEEVTGRSLEEILRSNLQSPRELRRTAPWKPPTPAVRDAAQDPAAPEIDDVVAYEFATLSIQPQKPGRLKAELARVKEKTRGRGSPSKDKLQKGDKECPSSEEDNVESVAKFHISTRAAKVFRHLFHNPGGDEVSRHDIDWKDFLHAMHQMGFAAEKLYGSVWHFTPEENEYKKSIHFHEPHPSGKISFVKARAFGRRLTRTYEWTGEMFAE